MTLTKKIVLIFIIILSILIFWEIIYFSSEPIDKYNCPNWSNIKKPLSLDLKSHKYKIINDVSCLNKTYVYNIVKVKSVKDIKKALKKAKEKELHISIAGVRHSMGGQAFFTNSIVLDMTEFNKIIELNKENKTIKVQSGATWHNIQLFLNEKNLAVKAMQSTDIFTVGGSVSVNAHGMDPHNSSVSDTVRSITIVMADGTIKKISRKNNLELFKLVIGGYGLFGVILEIELEITDNEIYRQKIDRTQYKKLYLDFENAINSSKYGLFYAHLSTSPLTFFQDAITYSYTRVSNYKGPFIKLRKVSLIKFRRLLLNLAKVRWYAKILKWIAESYIDPYITKILKKEFVSRNEVMHDSVEYLYNTISTDTDILQEYFVPKAKLTESIIAIKKVLKNHNAIILNASVRYVKKEDIFLNYAPEDMFAIVLYLNQKVTPKNLNLMKLLTKDLIDTILKLNGSFFLPYQLYFTKEQLKKAYPNINQFFRLKRKYDPNLIFMNNFYSKYS